MLNSLHGYNNVKRFEVGKDTAKICDIAFMEGHLWVAIDEARILEVPFIQLNTVHSPQVLQAGNDVTSVTCA